jgi:hypothetical protein
LCNKQQLKSLTKNGIPIINATKDPKPIYNSLKSQVVYPAQSILYSAQTVPKQHVKEQSIPNDSHVGPPELLLLPFFFLAPLSSVKGTKRTKIITNIRRRSLLIFNI